MGYRRFQWPDNGDVIELRRYPKDQIAETSPDVVVTGRATVSGKDDKAFLMLSPVGDARFDVTPEKYGKQFMIWDGGIYVNRKEFRARWDWTLVERSAENKYSRALAALQNAKYSAGDLRRKLDRLRQTITEAQTSLAETQDALDETERSIETLEADIPTLKEEARGDTLWSAH